MPNVMSDKVCQNNDIIQIVYANIIYLQFKNIIYFVGKLINKLYSTWEHVLYSNKKCQFYMKMSQIVKNHKPKNSSLISYFLYG